MTTRAIRIAAALLCLFLLLAGLARALLSPLADVYYENRPANRMPAFSPAAFLRGDFQAGAEAAFSDQLPMAIKLKKLYNIFDTGLALPAVRMLGADGSGYVGFRGVCFFRDMLVVRPTPLSDKEAALRTAAGMIGGWAERAPGTDFFVYYIETDRDLDLATGEKSGLYDCLAAALALPEGHVGRLRTDSFADYRACFLATDHHWNAAGAHRAYLDLCSMLDLTPLPLTGEHTVRGRYLGTRAAGVEGIPAGDFTVKLYEWPAMKVDTAFGSFSVYGQQEAFAADALETVSYGGVYGGDYGELVFHTDCPGRKLLVMGDSYDNAIARTLAAGFAESRFVDLRAYEAETGEVFDMTRYISAHGIDCVLFVGGIDYFGATLPVQGGA